MINFQIFITNSHENVVTRTTSVQKNVYNQKVSDKTLLTCAKKIVHHICIVQQKFKRTKYAGPRTIAEPELPPTAKRKALRC